MNVLLDTNVLTRAALPAHAQHRAAEYAPREVRRRGDRVCLVPQILYEFYVVSTRPEGETGLGITPDVARTELLRLRQLYPVFPEVPQVFAEWERLVQLHQVSGKLAHDARLVAAMNVHGIQGILTFNRRDFVRFPQITILTPDELITSSSP